MIAGVETGGTKVVCALAASDAPDAPVRLHRIPTTTPQETLGRIVDFLDEAERDEPLEALGIGSFGPVDAAPGSDRFGWITTTPKAGWAQTDVLGALRAGRDAPSAFLSDVSAAALGEQRWGAGREVGDLAYATVGTGVGVGLVSGGRVLGGTGWPELGHLLVRRHPDDGFAGVCPFHGDCLEGLASGPAVLARWGTDASSFAPDVREGALAVLADYLAQLVVTVVLTTGAERFVLGGGVTAAPGLLDLVRRQVAIRAAGYGPASLTAAPEALVVTPALGGSSGVIGALTAARDLLPA